MPNWDDFRVFLALARERTLAASARRLQIDQSTVGRRLATLESELRARLFDRTPKGYLLTAAGEAILPSAEDVERAALAAERRSLGDDARLEGQVHLATSDSFAVWFILPRLAPFAARHPAITVDFVLGDAVVDLAGREADLSLRFSKPTQPNLVARRLAPTGWAVYAAPSYIERRGLPKRGQSLRGHDVVAFARPLAGTAGARWLKKHGEGTREALVCNSLLSAAAAVEAGLGLGVLPCIFGDASARVRRVGRDLAGHHDLWLVVHADVRSSARVRAVMDFLLEIVTKSEAALLGRSGTESGSGQRKPPRDGRERMRA